MGSDEKLGALAVRPTFLGAIMDWGMAPPSGGA